MSATATMRGEQRVFLDDVRWETFLTLLHDVGEQPRGRLAYHQGLLEIMSPSSEHESIKSLIAHLIETLADELAIPLRALGSTTLVRADQQQAVEADESFYVGSHALVPRPARIDLARDPPPDLVVEIDLSRSSRARLRVHAALGIPEVWQWTGDRLRVLRLEQSGGYAEALASAAFATLPIAGLEPFLRLGREVDDTQVVREFRAWIRRVLPDRPRDAR